MEKNNKKVKQNRMKKLPAREITFTNNKNSQISTSYFVLLLKVFG